MMNTRDARLPIAACCALGLLGAACSDQGPPEWDPDSEVMLQLFVSSSLVDKIGVMEVSAQQVGTSARKVTIADPRAFFADCQSNRVRIIPAFEDGKLRGAITVTVSSSGGAFKTEARPLALDDPLMIVGPVSTELAPAGGCVPSVRPGGPDGGVEPDAGVRRAVGEPCELATQCEAGVCLRKVRIDFNNSRVLPNGYCSRPCDVAALGDCGAGLVCERFEEVRDKVVEVGYCMVSCKDDVTICREGEGYICTPGFLCFPPGE